MTNAIVPSQQNAITTQAPTLATAFDVVLYSLSETSKRQYQHTFKKWSKFADANGFHAMALTPHNIIDFLNSEQLAHSTKSARLSHLRKILETMHAQQPDNVQLESWYKQVKLLKVKRDENTQSAEREKHALKPKQIHDVLDCFDEDTKLHTRNRALLAVLFYAGLRRSEAVALQWRDIDFENGIISVRHGKGDKPREVPILSDTLTEYLGQWDAVTDGRSYVFCGVRKGDHLADDKPMTAKTAYKIVQLAGDMIGIENLAPHDARRSLITNGLQSGANVADMQFIAGHADPSTTLGYAIVKDAKEVAGRVKLNF